MENQDSQYPLNSVQLLNFILSKSKQLVGIIILALVVSSIIAYLIPERFKSTVIIFPATYSSVSKGLLLETDKVDINRFGEEEEIEQLLQVLKSSKIRNQIAAKFGLMQHYDIDPSSQFPKTKLYRKYRENFSFERTKYMSIEIEVLDENAQLAADMANYICDLIDENIVEMQHTRFSKAFEMIEREYFHEIDYLTSLEDSLRIIQSKGINDYETQSERFNEAYAQALAKGNTKGAKILEEKMQVLSEYGSVYLSLKNKIEFAVENFMDLKQKYREAKIDLDQKLPQKFIVDKAEKAERKSYPIRWLIVLVFTFSTLIFSILVFLVGDKSLKKN